MSDLFERKAWIADGALGRWGKEAQFLTGHLVLKENNFQAMGFQILAMRMKVNMVVFPLKFESWIEEHEM